MAKKKTAKKSNKMLLWIVVFVLVCVAAVVSGLMAIKGNVDVVNKMEATDYVEIDIENYGVITAELYGNMAPITVENFLKLADEGFYDGLTFHRIISGFMIQGGDPLGNGMGGSDENIKGEFAANGVENSISHSRGVLSMARSNMYDSASSQFFIMHADAQYLDGQYAGFGSVISGIEIVDAICENTPVTDANGSVEPVNQPRILSIKRVEKNEE